MEVRSCIKALQALIRGGVPLDAATYRKIVFWADPR